MDFIVRSYLNRALGQCTRFTVREFVSYCDQSLTLLSNPLLRERFPQLPWKQYQLAVHKNRLQVAYIVQEGASVDPDMLAAAEESALYVVGHISPESCARARCLSNLYMAQYYCGHRTLDSLVTELRELADHCNTESFQESDIWDNIYLPTLYLYYLHAEAQTASEVEPDLQVYHAEESRRLIQMLDYCRRISSREYIDYALVCIRKVLMTMSISDQIPMTDKVLYTIMQFHQPTYIHSEIVARLMTAMAEALLEREPERFMPLLQVKTRQEVLDRRQEVLHFVRGAGRSHDVGKLFCLSVISIYHRHLSDSEMDLIRMHPSVGYQLLKSSKQVGRYAQSALMHHRSYDGRKGYPELPRDFVRDPALDIVTDLLTVADAMDAATDTIGRSYTAGTSFEQLLQEYRIGYNTRYAGYIVDLLEDTSLQQKLCRILKKDRSDLYYYCYCRYNRRNERNKLDD